MNWLDSTLDKELQTTNGYEVQEMQSCQEHNTSWLSTTKCPVLKSYTYL